MERFLDSAAVPGFRRVRVGAPVTCSGSATKSWSTRASGEEGKLVQNHDMICSDSSDVQRSLSVETEQFQLLITEAPVNLNLRNVAS